MDAKDKRKPKAIDHQLRKTKEKGRTRKYLLTFLLLLMVEVTIAYFHFSSFIRGFIGDVLVMLLIYSFIKIFIRKGVFPTALGVLVFAFIVEFLQYFRLAEKLNITSKPLLIILGSVFDLWDLVAYLIGFLLILLVENHHHFSTIFTRNNSI